jgi:glucose-6-phosphate isomerase
MIGAAKAREELSSDDLDQNIAYQYATIRNLLIHRIIVSTIR